MSISHQVLAPHAVWPWLDAVITWVDHRLGAHFLWLTKSCKTKRQPLYKTDPGLGASRELMLVAVTEWKQVFGVRWSWFNHHWAHWSLIMHQLLFVGKVWHGLVLQSETAWVSARSGQSVGLSIQTLLCEYIYHLFPFSHQFLHVWDQGTWARPPLLTSQLHSNPVHVVCESLPSLCISRSRTHRKHRSISWWHKQQHVIYLKTWVSNTCFPHVWCTCVWYLYFLFDWSIWWRPDPLLLSYLLEQRRRP